MFAFSLGLSLWGWSPGRVGEGCGGRWPLALPEDPVWLGVPSSGWWPSVPLKWPSHATAGNTLSSIVSTARGLLMLHLPCLLLPGSPSEPLLTAGETALGLSAWNLHEKSESEKQLLTSIYMQSILFKIFLDCPCSYHTAVEMLVSLPFCSSPKPRGHKGFVFPSPQPQPVPLQCWWCPKSCRAQPAVRCSVGVQPWVVAAAQLWVWSHGIHSSSLAGQQQVGAGSACRKTGGYRLQIPLAR